MKHIHLIPADFEDFNIDDLIAERNGNSIGVCWKNGEENGTRAQAFNKDDTVYIYFHDSRHLTDRILIRAKVVKSDSTDDDSDEEYKNEYLFSNYCKMLLKQKEKKNNMTAEEIEKYKEYSESKIKGFYLGEFRAIKQSDEKKFKYKHGKKDDDDTGIMGVRINQTKVYLDKQGDDKYKNLLSLLDSQSFNRNLSRLRDDYNDDSCIICTKSEKGIHTFLNPNNLYYYEVHHILQQSFKNKQDKYDWFDAKKYLEGEENTLIYNDYNEVNLCPYHHRLLHYGKYEDRKKVLDKLVNQGYIDKLKEKVQNNNDCEKIIEYIYEQYGLNYKK